MALQLWNCQLEASIHFIWTTSLIITNDTYSVLLIHGWENICSLCPIFTRPYFYEASHMNWAWGEPCGGEVENSQLILESLLFWVQLERWSYSNISPRILSHSCKYVCEEWGLMRVPPPGQWRRRQPPNWKIPWHGFCKHLLTGVMEGRTVHLAEIPFQVNTWFKSRLDTF